MRQTCVYSLHVPTNKIRNEIAPEMLALLQSTVRMVPMFTAYLSNGTYNVFIVDWGSLCRPPCYAAAVHNMKPVARCASQLFKFMRSSGVQQQRTTCVGHSLGAHVCGLVSLTLLFRMHRIIGK